MARLVGPKSKGQYVLEPWPALSGPLRGIVTGILAAWRRLLSQRSAPDSAYHDFLRAHAGFFFCDSINSHVAISKLRLGADVVPDFISTIDQASYGLAFHFIEIESPHSPAYTRAGKPSARLMTAVQQ